MSFEKIVESQIQEAIERGEFSGLPGEGRPLRIDPLDALAGSDWLGFHVLRDSRMLPEWLELAKDIERDEEGLDALRDQFASLVDHSHETDTWDANIDRLMLLIEEFCERGRRLRTKQDRFNAMAPGAATQRPGIWVQEKRRQLADIMCEHGAPQWAVERSFGAPNEREDKTA